MSSASRTRPGWTLAIVSIALFMTALDNLVVGVALPSIRADLGGSIETLEWTVNAYTLAFAVFLLTGAALGDRFGRKRMFVIGLGIFTLASALSALAPSIEALIAARAVQGFGAAIVLPLTLTLLSEAFPRREARSRARRLGRRHRSRRRARARSSAAPSSRASRGTGSSGSTSRSASRWSRSRCALLTESHGPATRSTSPASRWRAPACSG